MGASQHPGKTGHVVLQNLISGGFPGRLVPVNPNAGAEILGLPAAPSVAAIGAPIDMAVIVVPARQVLAVSEEAIQAGVRALVVITAGFREAGPEGAAMETALAARCREAGVALLGPNCLGIVNTAARMNASFAPQMAIPGGISVISQSGALCTAILDMANASGLGLAKLISIGNKADLCETTLLPLLAADPQTSVIACYLESIGKGAEFIAAAEAAARIKPVVVLKAGITEAGGRAAVSHTGALAGGAVAYAAAFRRAGVIQAKNFEALFDIATAFQMQPLPAGDRVAIITNAGGPGILAADAVEGHGMKVQGLRRDIADRLKAKLPAMAHVGNPIDVLGDASPDRYRSAIDAAVEDDSVEAIIVILTPQAMTDPSNTARTIINASRHNKPVFAAFMGGRDVAKARREFVAADVPDYATPDRAAVALKAMWDYAEWRRRPARHVARFEVNKERVGQILARYQADGQRQVNEYDAKAILHEYGFNTLPGAIAQNAEAACAISDRVGYPVAMKIVSPDIVHKSDMGGVRLALWNRDAVLDAYDLMTLRIGRNMPNAHITGVYVERMADPGQEIIIGMTRDPQFGPLLMFGLGGVFVEVVHDVSFSLAPITAGEAREMLEQTRAFALLKGARGRAPVGLDAIVVAIQRISQLAIDLPAVAELDLNPLMVYGDNVPPVLVDARITLTLKGEKDAASS